MRESQKLLQNPYNAGPPVFGKNFFGREEIFQQIRRALVMSRQRVVVLNGQRRIGKTSILKELPSKLVEDDFVTVNFDLQFYAGRSLASVLFALAQSISVALVESISNEVELPPFEHKNFERDEFFFENMFLPAVEAHLAENERLLILIDEFDIIRETDKGPTPVASFDFASLLQRLIINENKLSFMLIAGSNLAALAEYMQAVFRLGAAVRVAFFSQNETRKLIEGPAQGILTYTDEAIEEIFRLTTGHPYFTQLLCSEISNHLLFSENTDNRVVESEVVGTAAKKSFIAGMGAFAWIWKELTLAERVYLSAIALTVSKENTQSVSEEAIKVSLKEYSIHLVGVDLPNAANDLVVREFVEKTGPSHYRFTVELFRRWIEKEYPLDSIKQDIENINPVARKEYEQAREAHLTGRLEEAIKHYQAAVRFNANHARAQIGLAQALYEKEDWERAVEEFEKAQTLDEANAKTGLLDALLAYGNHLEKERNTVQALSIYNKVLESAPGNLKVKTRIERLKKPSFVKRLISSFRIEYPQKRKSETVPSKYSQTQVKAQIPNAHATKLRSQKISNPYIAGPPVGPPQFFGREGVISKVFNTLEYTNQNCIILSGQRRVGKTSLLHEISRRGQEASQVFVYFDISSLDKPSANSFFYNLARNINF